jgi:hypothetical protein
VLSLSVKETLKPYLSPSKENKKIEEHFNGVTLDIKKALTADLSGLFFTFYFT